LLQGDWILWSEPSPGFFHSPSRPGSATLKALGKNFTHIKL
jgi:hypothetical protein